MPINFNLSASLINLNNLILYIKISFIRLVNKIVELFYGFQTILFHIESAILKGYL